MSGTEKTIVDRRPADGLRQETLTQIGGFEPIVVSPKKKTQKNKNDTETNLSMTLVIEEEKEASETDSTTSDSRPKSTVKANAKPALPKTAKEYFSFKFKVSQKGLYRPLCDGLYFKHLHDDEYIWFCNKELFGAMDAWRVEVFKKLTRGTGALPLSKEQVNQRDFANYELLKLRQNMESPNNKRFAFGSLNFKALHNLLGSKHGKETLFFLKSLARCRRFTLDFEEVSVRDGFLVITRFDASWKGYIFGSRVSRNGRYDRIRSDSILVDPQVIESDDETDFHQGIDDTSETGCVDF